MARNIYANITARGTKGVFMEKLETVPQIWEKFAQTIPSDAPDEEHVWMGNVPNPREFISQRSLVGIRDFTYNVANKEYELSFIIDQNSLEDDRHGLINRRISEAAQVWAAFKDVLFAALMNDGQTSGNNSYDGVTFFNNSHVIGSSTSPPESTTDVDNLLASSSPSDPSFPTVAEMKVLVSELFAWIQGVTDDTNRPGYNWGAMSSIAIMGNPTYQQALTEVLAAQLLGGGDSNVFFQNLATPVINPYLGGSNDYLYVAALGDAARMPIIHQERTALQINILNSPDDIAQNHGLLVLVRQRFRLTYGEPRRMAVILIT